MATNKKGITIRFEDDEMAKLDELAARYHVSSATIIRWALKALGEYVEANGGKITLPLDFSTFYRKSLEFESLKAAEDVGQSKPFPKQNPVKYPSAGNGTHG
jgi:hypothetical protein